MKKLLIILSIVLVSCKEKVISVGLKPQPPKLTTDTFYYKTLKTDTGYTDVQISKKEFVKLKKAFE